MATAKSMTELYEREKDTTSKYVHATSRGHESAQLALALHLEAKDYVAPYYRDDSLLLGIGMTPKDLMQADLTHSKEAAMHVLAMIRHKEYMRKARMEALRAQHIEEGEITG